jgi:hypothetical protein
MSPTRSRPDARYLTRNASDTLDRAHHGQSHAILGVDALAR